MNSEDVFIASPYARQAIRYARRSGNLDLLANNKLPATIDRASCDGGIPDLSGFGFDVTGTNRRIGFWFADHASRCQQKGVSCHVVTPSLPVDAFVSIQVVDQNRVPMEGERIRCESPNFTVLTYAQELQDRVRKRTLQHGDAVVLITAYVMELIGTYSKDPRDPRHGQDSFKLDAATTRDSLLKFLERMRRYPCVTMARRAAELAVEGAASRMETLTSLVTSLPPRYGGASLGVAALNTSLELNEKELRLIKHRSIRPDLLWNPYRLIVEYEGGDYHSAPKQKREDKYRMQDYQTLGYTVLPITYEERVDHHRT